MSTYRVVTFRVGEQLYALDVSHVREVHPLEHVAPVPCTPPFVSGVMNLRGSLCSIVDVALFFGLTGSGGGGGRRHVVLAEAAGLTVGLLADQVFDLEAVDAARIDPPLATQRGPRQEHIRGIIRENMAVLLNATSLFQDSRFIVNDNVD